MKVTNVHKCTVYYVETDNGQCFGDYRRGSSDIWEVCMGESWEPVYNYQEIEDAFQKYLKSNTINDC